MKKQSRAAFLTQRIFETLEGRQMLALVPLEPQAANDSYNINEDQILTGNVVAGTATTGADVSAKAGLPLQVVQVDGQSFTPGSPLILSSGATLAVNASGAFTYDASSSASLSSLPAGSSQADGFSYTVAPDFSNIFVFGDSLSDQGQLYDDFGFPPFPYFEGRVSNGPVWIEGLADQLGLPLTLANNFSVAGATTSDANYNESILMTDLDGLSDQLQSFLGGLNGQPADPSALYVVWAGSNDFFVAFDPLNPNPPSPAQVIGEAVTNIATTVGTLQAYGAQHILVLNMPDLGLTPYASQSIELTQQMTALSSAFNSTLQGALAGPGLQATLVDIFSTFQAVVANPAAFGLTNVTQACFDGVGSVIGNPADFLFWDSVHPTEAGHRLIADAVLDALSDTADATIQVTDSTTPPQLTVTNTPGSGLRTLQVQLSATDASPADQGADFDYVVNWGDGSPVQTVTASAAGTVLTHTYAAGVVQKVSAFVRDQDGDVSPTLREVVTWGTQASDIIRIVNFGQNKVRIYSGHRTVATLNTADFDRLVVFGLGGNDLISAIGILKPVEFDGGAGRDSLFGGRGSDILRGGTGDDVIYGFDGHDYLSGDAGRDILFGGNGNDTLDGGAGDDYLFGQAGDDWLLGASGVDWIFDVQGRNRRQDD